MVTFSDNFQPKSSHKYLCNICDFKTSKKCNYLEHINSKKHKSSIVSDVCDKNQTKNKPLDKKYICVNCQKVYLSRNGLWCHKKKCTNLEEGKSEQKQSEINNISSLITPELIVELIKDNRDMKQIILELCKNGITNTTNYSSSF